MLASRCNCSHLGWLRYSSGSKGIKNNPSGCFLEIWRSQIKIKTKRVARGFLGIKPELDQDGCFAESLYGWDE